MMYRAVGAAGIVDQFAQVIGDGERRRIEQRVIQLGDVACDVCAAANAGAKTGTGQSRGVETGEVVIRKFLIPGIRADAPVLLANMPKSSLAGLGERQAFDP